MRYLRLILTVLILMISIYGVSCTNNGGEPAESESVPAKETTISQDNRDYPDYDLTTAIEKISSLATRLTIKSYQSRKQTLINKDDPEFATIISFIEQSVITKSQKRFVEDETGKTATVTIIYCQNYLFTLTLSDGSEIVFDYGGDIWFNSKDMIYGASIDDKMFELIQQIADE